MIKQKTITKAAEISGVGLHTGEQSTARLLPAPVGHGIKIKRVDLPDQPVIPADIDYIQGLERGTSIGMGDIKVFSMEHLMAACAGLEIDNLLVELNANEIPLVDGSALPFVRMLRESGPLEQDAPRHYITLHEPILYENGSVALSVFPASQFRVTLMIDYQHPALGAQHTTLFDLSEFEKEYAPARTFCFLSDVLKLRESGIIKGASLESGIVVQDMEHSQDILDEIKTLFNQKEVFWGDNGFLNNTDLIFPNELCRHKAMDLMGDLYLLGAPLRAHVLGARTGHAANIEMAKLIRKSVQEKESEVSGAMDVNMISKILPHRYPFLLVDKVLDLVPGKRISAIKNVTMNEPFFQGHFPGLPVMPGVLQIEALAQAGGLIAMSATKEQRAQVVYFMAVDKARFRKPVVPGDQLRLEVEVIRMKGKTAKMAGKAYVEDKVVCEAELMATIADKR